MVPLPLVLPTVLLAISKTPVVVPVSKSPVPEMDRTAFPLTPVPLWPLAPTLMGLFAEKVTEPPDKDMVAVRDGFPEPEPDMNKAFVDERT